ncbi:serine/threonine-protein kinase ATG1c-like [Actinidia eriantha]|uniref:serine/threonine-protein kinase ATG1c-like n=1 Tax=Actinidia eriantha TaxID=165200 RepID=UPI0025888927|nr:serine/threonine-protein kinase ATG1c-like [Actinidia eriantha]XP_057511833.1 serine/threonine-protein kinase ATG1c-like [Actinidia eriantha]
MAQSTSRGGGRYVGDYVVGQQIGAGSFSVVWHARHKVHDTEVAIKEIVTGRLNKKLHESLMSEIVILKQINHPNIIRLHDIIEETGRIHLVLEFCRGGDLSMYIQQRQGRVPEATAKYFMQQLAAGLQILRENNLIHRDLKPQNLLLSTNSDNAVLKIADFGFARSLQPRGLAETLCGSPLYMAPEIMQLQKYDAKADLWSVGAILFQLVTGRTPFTGNNQIQLLQNIMKSTELQFPPEKKNLNPDCIDLCRKLLRRNPVERLTFEEFFNHPFLSQGQPDELLRNRRSQRTIDSFPFSEHNLVRNAEEGRQDDWLPFSLDDDSRGPDRGPSFVRRPSMKSTFGFSLDDRKEVSNTSDKMDLTSKFNSVSHKPENTSFRLESRRPPEGNLKEAFKSTEQRPMNTHSRVVDSLELFDQEYVIVSGPPMDVSSSSASASKLSHSPCNLESSQHAHANVTSTPSAPMPIIGATGSRVGYVGSFDSHSSAPSGTSQGSMDIGDALEQPSTHCMTRIKSLQRCASAVIELVNEKIKAGRQLEAFSIQLVILAIWKQALHICHTQAMSADEGSPIQEMTRLRENHDHDHGSPDIANTEGSQDFCSQIERRFLVEVENAEELAKVIEPGNTEMPDAMETIYQSALSLGRHGAVDEYMGDMETAAVRYSKAVRLLVFLLVEAPSLILNPPLSLTTSDRYRLRNYIDVLNNRQSHSRSQRMALLQCEDQQCPP